MNNSDFTKEKIKMLQSEMNYLWSGIFITGGGSITLLLAKMSIIHLILAIIGMIACLLFLNGFLGKRMTLIELVNSLKNTEA